MCVEHSCVRACACTWIHVDDKQNDVREKRERKSVLLVITRVDSLLITRDGIKNNVAGGEATKYNEKIIKLVKERHVG